MQENKRKKKRVLRKIQEVGMINANKTTQMEKKVAMCV